ncbi:MFS transporter [Ponticoccus sp. SC2-23]|uniref:MFS transporter n=1 Tax=Alexandriicola marinus TaxID=2081710 RepID=UPI000FDB1200|nr:MFS transporter [Alexandriicola marinus]MBM1219293.1 MFS transporter [Ponticoccus sp. SC6-9]MBM1223635.1 MFS transporter [Ponticoccus sp. SC6-15]MBM1229106.1 MFS transporter [Ponticoccus sp. SC6-38]MBM1232601.1 MFS transporter [Ponticoccus sp. SC6-45]MBM1237449.1 MFS transporter [Ponticoccus sp. SC6-49]MBM1241612.1 MFS transporter [Ponticoccus sp. SC2-64]MBM1246125.1 MFS transporter [Ponticoccus sp. SC6-42]MBM1250603.1 MFS transporter [Ponticoccus sp. SC6-33]MBM1255458.1 MFS transporter
MRTNWRLIWALYAAGLLAGAQFAKIALTLEALSAQWPGAPVTIAVSALSIMGIIFGVAAGVIAALFGPARVLLTGLFAAAVLSALQAFLPPFWMFLGLRLVEGAAHLAIVVAAPALIAGAAIGPDRPVAMGLWGTFFGVSFALTAAVASVLTEPGPLYLAHAAAMLAVLIWLRPQLSRGFDGVRERLDFWRRHIDIYGDVRRIAPGLCFVFHTVLFLGVLTFLPRFVGGWTAPFLPLVAIIGTFAAGVLSRRIAPWRVTVWGYLLSAAGLGLLTLCPEAWRGIAAMPVMVILGIAPGSAFANVTALNHEAGDQARATGAMAQLGNVGTALSVPLFATVLWAGLPGLVVLAAALSLIAAGVVWLIHRNLPQTA